MVPETSIPAGLAPDVGVAVELLKRARATSWRSLTDGLSHSQPYVLQTQSDRLDEIQAWLATRVGDRPSFVQSAVANFARVLDDLLLVLNYELEPREDSYWVRKWYHRGLGGSGDFREVEFYGIHVLLIRNLTAELTRAINLALVRVRRADPQVLDGLGLATIDTGAHDAPTRAALYSDEEQRTPQPYLGLRGFPAVISSRDLGALGVKAEGIPRAPSDFGEWITELLRRRSVTPSGAPPAAVPPFSLPRPASSRLADEPRSASPRRAILAAPYAVIVFFAALAGVISSTPWLWHAAAGAVMVSVPLRRPLLSTPPRVYAIVVLAAAAGASIAVGQIVS